MSRKKRSSTRRFKLTLKQRLFFVFFGAGLAILGMVLLWSTGQVNTLDCRRVETTRIDCTNQTQWLGLLTIAEQSIQQLQGASVSNTCSKDDQSDDNRTTCVYSVELATIEGGVSLSPFLASGGNQTHKYEFVEQVNAFIRDPAVPALRATYSEMAPQTIVVGVVSVPYRKAFRLSGQKIRRNL